MAFQVRTAKLYRKQYQETFVRLTMQVDRLNESELKETLAIAQKGESKLKEMSDRATILSEKWRVKISKPKNINSKND